MDRRLLEREVGASQVAAVVSPALAFLRCLILVRVVAVNASDGLQEAECGG